MEKQNINSELGKNLSTVFGTKIKDISDYRGDLSILIAKEDILEVCTELKKNKDFQFEQMIDLTAVDYLEENLEYRFQMVYHFLSVSKSQRLRVKCNLNEDDATVDSIYSLWLAVNWYERECFDMYGIRFNGHPELKRILMYEEFEGHPLRKDYNIAKEQPLLPLREVKERHGYMEDYSA